MSDGYRAMVAAFIVFLCCVSLGLSVAKRIEDKEMATEKAKCEEVGGVYIPQYGVPAICFSPDAIKGDKK